MEKSLYEPSGTVSRAKNFRSLIMGLFALLFCLNITDLLDDLLRYQKARVLLQIFEDRPLRNAAENETYLASLSEEKKDRGQNVLMGGVQIFVIGFLWVYVARKGIGITVNSGHVPLKPALSS